MSKKLVPLAAFAVTALILSAVAAGGTRMTKMNFSAVLNAGQEVHPRPVGTKVGAAGKFTAIIGKVADHLALDRSAKLTFEVSDGIRPMELYRASQPTLVGDTVQAELSPRPASCKPRDRWLQVQPPAGNDCRATPGASSACCG